MKLIGVFLFLDQVNAKLFQGGTVAVFSKK